MGETDNGKPAPAPAGRRRKALAIVGAGAIVSAVAGFLFWQYRQTHITTDDAYVDGRIHLVSARVPGKVVAVLVEDDQKVKAGDPLLRIDPEPYGVRAAAARAQLAAAGADSVAARSDLEASRADIRAAEKDLEAARAQLGQVTAGVETARARVTLAEARRGQAVRDAERARNLFERHAISRERNEKAQTELEVATAQRDVAADELRLAEAAVPTQEAMISQREAILLQRRSVLGQREARVGQQAATVRQREAALAEARLNSGYTEVTSPADGYVTRKSVETGQIVSAGQPLLAVAALTDVWVLANYKETQISKIHPGQEVRIQVDTYAGKRFRGKVASLMAGTGSAFSLFPPENATGNYVKVVQRVPVKIVLEKGEDPGHVLRIGMSVTPTVLVGKR